MGTGNGLIAKFQEFSTYAVDHGFVTNPEFNSIRIVYSEWYASDEDDGTKVPKDGMSKYAAGILLYQQIDEQLTTWRNVTMSNEPIEESTTESNEDKVSFGTKVIVTSAVVGYSAGKALNISYHKGIKPAVKDGVVPATKTFAKATVAGAKAFWAGLKNK